MQPSDATTDEFRDPVEELAEQFLAEVRAGKNITVADYQHRYPEHAESIEALFPTLLMMEDLKPAARNRDSADTLLDRNVQRLGDFRILRKLGFGGMGIVYEAQQESLERPVAIKVFAPTLLSSPRLINRFKREAKAAGALHHSNIVPVLGVGEQWGIHYYIMQLIDGKGLDQILDAQRDHLQVESAFRFRRDWNRIADIGRQLASALEYAHSRNVLHRDIKPANLLLDRDGTAWIADFGLAKLMTDDDGVTRSGQAVGTLRYMAPEQFTGKVDQRSDIYALGLTLFEMLTWRRAFDETDHGKLVRQKTINIPPRPRSLESTIPRDMETIVMKAIAPEPQNRYQTAAALEEDLRRFLDDEPILARRISYFERLVRWSRRNRALAATSAVVLALAAALLGITLWSYLSVQNALRGQMAQRQKATAASTLATGALDSVFERFGIEPIADIEQSGEPMLSAEAAALLENLLSYYEALAEQDSSNPDLMLKAAQAQAIIGDIHQRLGHYDNSLSAYAAAIDKYRDLPDSEVRQVTMAALHNQSGQVLRLDGDEETGIAQHKLALELLDDIGVSAKGFARSISEGPISEDAKFELARTYYLLGRRIRPGMGPESMPPESAFAPDDASDSLAVSDPESDQVQALEEAVRLLERSANQPNASARLRQLLARCLREYVPDSLTQRSDRDRRIEARAVQLFETLMQQHPNDADYQHDLVETLAEFTVFGNSLNERVFDDAQARLQRAVALGDALVNKRPDVAAHLLVVAHAHFKLARVLTRQSRASRGPENRELLTAASDHLTSAIDLLSELTYRFPQANGFAVWMAYFYTEAADIALQLFQPEEAQDLSSYAIEIIESLPEEIRGLPTVLELTNLAYDRLFNVFRWMGTPEDILQSIGEP